MTDASDQAAKLIYIAPDNPIYPNTIQDFWLPDALPTLSAIGNLEILQQNAIALFCSVKCPGDLILKTYDLAQAWRDAGVTVISGFHSPMEKECRRFLMRGTQPMIHCPARSLETMRLSMEQKEAIVQNQLLILSPFPAKQKRMTAALAETRNRLVGAIASQIFIAYADPGSKTAQLAQECLNSNKPIFTFDSPNTQNLRQIGATALSSVARISTKIGSKKDDS